MRSLTVVLLSLTVLVSNAAALTVKNGTYVSHAYTNYTSSITLVGSSSSSLSNLAPTSSPTPSGSALGHSSRTSAVSSSRLPFSSTNASTIATAASGHSPPGRAAPSGFLMTMSPFNSTNATSAHSTADVSLNITLHRFHPSKPMKTHQPVGALSGPDPSTSIVHSQLDSLGPNDLARPFLGLAPISDTLKEPSAPTVVNPADNGQASALPDNRVPNAQASNAPSPASAFQSISAALFSPPSPAANPGQSGATPTANPGSPGFQVGGNGGVSEPVDPPPNGGPVPQGPTNRNPSASGGANPVNPTPSSSNPENPNPGNPVSSQAAQAVNLAHPVFASNVDGHSLSAQGVQIAAGGGVAVGSATLHAGEQTTFQGTQVSVAGDGVVFGGSTLSFAPPLAPSPAPVNQPAIRQGPNGGLVIGATTILPGNEGTVNGHKVSVDSAQVHVDGSTIALPDAAPATASLVIFGGNTVQPADNGGVVIGSSTYAQGAQASVSGHAVSVGAGTVVVDGSTQAVPSPSPPMVLGGVTAQAASNGGVVLGSSTYAQGAQATVSGHVVSIGSGNAVVDGSTQFIPVPSSSPIVFGGNTVQAAPNGGVVVGSSTYAQGAQATISGHAVSVGSANVVVDGSTQAFPPPASPVMVGGNAVLTVDNGGIVVGSSTYTLGAQATVSGHAISVGTGNVVVDGSTLALPISATPIVMGGVNVQPASNGAGVVVGSSTIVGGSQATISGHAISVGSTNIVVDGSTQALPTAAPSPVVIGGVTAQPAPSGGGILIGSSTLSVGSQATISGHAISVGSSNIVVDGSTQAIPTSSSLSPLVIGGITAQTAPNGGVVIGSSTLVAGAQAMVSGHAISVGSANIVIDGTTQALASPTASPVLIDGSSMQRASNGGLVIGSLTLPPGAQTTIAGHTISVGSSSILLDGSTYALPTSAGAVIMTSSTPTIVTLPNGAVMTAGGSVAALPGGVMVTAGGAAVTVSGTVISLGSSELKVGSSTITLPMAVSSSSPLISSGFNAQATGSTTTSPDRGVSTPTGKAGASDGAAKATSAVKGGAERMGGGWAGGIRAVLGLGTAGLAFVL